MGAFIGRNWRAMKVVSRRTERIVSGKGDGSWGWGEDEEGPRDQKIPDRLMRITLLGKSEAVMRSSIQSGFTVMGFSTSDSTSGLWLSLERFAVHCGIC